MAVYLTKKRPTVHPIKDFNPQNDVIALKDGLKGFLADDKVLINILAFRSNHQRREIIQQYMTSLGRSLFDDIKNSTKGNLASILNCLLMPIDEFLAKQINNALTGLVTDDDALIECLCGLTNVEMKVINQKYLDLYKRKLEDDIVSNVSGSFQRLLVSLLNGGRDESQRVDKDTAIKDVVKLLNAAELIIGTDDSVFNDILCTRNFLQIRKINTEYKNLVGYPLIDAIEKQFTGDFKNGLQAIIQFANDPHAFFAYRLYKSMVGLGTNDTALIRLVVWRSEIDLENIKETFENLYKSSLKSWIKDDTSGNYRKCLFALIGDNMD